MMQLRVNNKRKGERTNFRNQILLLRETFRRGREREREHCLAWRHLFPLLLCSSCILSLCILSLSIFLCCFRRKISAHTSSAWAATLPPLHNIFMGAQEWGRASRKKIFLLLLLCCRSCASFLPSSRRNLPSFISQCSSSFSFLFLKFAQSLEYRTFCGKRVPAEKGERCPTRAYATLFPARFIAAFPVKEECSNGKLN